MYSTMTGQRIPEMVPIPFERPIRMLAYLGAMSRWLTLYPVQKKTFYAFYLYEHLSSPEMANPLKETAKMRAAIAVV